MLKNLATCTPREFFVQTNRIRKLAKEWLAETKVLDLRKVVNEIGEGVAKEISTETDDNEIKKKATAGVMERLNDILDKLLEDDVDKTVELLCLCCFVPPKDADKHQMSEFFESITDMITNEAVISFFMSLTGLRQAIISA